MPDPCMRMRMKSGDNASMHRRFAEVYPCLAMTVCSARSAQAPTQSPHSLGDHEANHSIMRCIDLSSVGTGLASHSMAPNPWAHVTVGGIGFGSFTRFGCRLLGFETAWSARYLIAFLSRHPARHFRFHVESSHSTFSYSTLVTVVGSVAYTSKYCRARHAKSFM